MNTGISDQQPEKVGGQTSIEPVMQSCAEDVTPRFQDNLMRLSGHTENAFGKMRGESHSLSAPRATNGPIAR